MLLITTVLTVLGTGLILQIYDHLLSKPPFVFQPGTKYEPSEVDQELIKKGMEIIMQIFPQGIDESMLNLEPEERLEKIKMLTERIVECYGVDVKIIEFLSTEQLMERHNSPHTCGYFSLDLQTIVFNADMLAVNDARVLRDAIDTVIHECRHAFQHKAINEAGFGNVDEEILRLWKLNFHRYVRPESSLEDYYNQAVEFDARSFAALTLLDI